MQKSESKKKKREGTKTMFASVFESQEPESSKFFHIEMSSLRSCDVASLHFFQASIYDITRRAMLPQLGREK